MAQDTRNQIYMPDSWEHSLDAPAEGKRKWPRDVALNVARELVRFIRDFCEPDRLKVCGSLRRMKSEVGDVELVFVPRMRCVEPERRDLFGAVESAAVWEPGTGLALDALVAEGVISPRLKRDGSRNSWGRWNRFAVHVETGVPVDFFGCVEASWWNTVVCRTGGALSNTAICNAAIAKGWHWEPSPEAAGFKRLTGLGWERHSVASEEEVFEFVGLPFFPPEKRR